jgi:hypothetical protein
LFTSLPWPQSGPGGVEELLELGGRHAVPRGGAHDDGVGPLEVGERGLGHVLRLQAVRGPALVAGDGLLGGELAHLEHAHLAAAGLGAVLDGAGQGVGGAGGTVIDDGDLHGHGDHGAGAVGAAAGRPGTFTQH